MTEAFTPLGPQATIAAAHRIFDQVDRALSLRRGLEKVTDRELISIVIFVRQLDAIARTAAKASVRNDLDAWTALQEQLLVPGYLPLPAPLPASPTKEPAHGEG